MRQSCCLFFLTWSVPLLGVSLVDAAPAADPLRLHYVARYDRNSEHLMGVESVLGHYALVSSNVTLTLIDLDTLPPGGTQDYLDRIFILDTLTTVTRDDGYAYANLRQAGLAVVYVDVSTESLSLITEISEPDVFFEKISIVGDRLYVAAHAYGIRIYDLTDPAAPTLAGSLADGFDDAWAIAVAGETAYVADGAGGLKIVDLSNEAAPRIVAGETPQTAAGTAQDVLVVGSHVYVAAGGAGVAAYRLGELGSRTLYDTPNAAVKLARVGEHLAVADIGGVEIFAIEPDGSLSPAAHESALRRSRGKQQVSTRLWYGVSAWGDARVVAADWDTVDVYELVDPDQDDQPDITASTQRIPFAPDGGNTVVRISNDGSGVLQAVNIYATEPTVTVQPQAATLQPSQSLDLAIEYAGGQPGQALVMIASNDPDENPLPIQVFGETAYLDPGEPATPFTLEAWRFDHATGGFSYDTFDLEANAGRVIYFRVFGTW